MIVYGQALHRGVLVHAQGAECAACRYRHARDDRVSAGKPAPYRVVETGAIVKQASPAGAGFLPGVADTGLGNRGARAYRTPRIEVLAAHLAALLIGSQRGATEVIASKISNRTGSAPARDVALGDYLITSGNACWSDKDLLRFYFIPDSLAWFYYVCQ